MACPSDCDKRGYKNLPEAFLRLKNTYNLAYRKLCLNFAYIR